MHSSYVKCFWKLEKLLWTISDVWGTVHAMCGQELRMSEEQHIFRHAWGLDLTQEYMEFPWNSLVHSHWCLGLGNTVSSSRGPGRESGHSLPGGGPWPLPGLLGRTQDWVSRKWQWDLLGEAISCQPKQKLLKMLKQLRKRTLSICLTALV